MRIGGRATVAGSGPATAEAGSFARDGGPAAADRLIDLDPHEADLRLTQRRQRRPEVELPGDVEDTGFTINLTMRIACARSSSVARLAEGTGSIPDQGDVVSCRSYSNSLSGCVFRVSRQDAACFSTSG
jgi:hypothetical protein